MTRYAVSWTLRRQQQLRKEHNQMNDVKLLGRITADLELRSTNTGKSVTTFNLAVDRVSKNKDEKETDFFTIVCWGKLAEFATRYLGKGRQIVVSGRLQNRKWQDKHGQNRISTEVVADNLYFADSKQSGAGSEQSAAFYDDFEVINDDDLPFN